jgi:FKBP-type peptidyl-prolyl cis-trans isomerase FklB
MRVFAALFAVLLLVGCGDPPVRQPRKLSPAAENRIAGQRFLAENGRKPGVITTASGLQYQVVTAGTGPIPTLQDVVQVHYRGSLVNGTVFENSRDRGDAAARIPVRGVIRGWSEALQLMPVGSVWNVYIPSNLAYGLDNAPEKIGPNQTLVFTLELIGIER